MATKKTTEQFEYTLLDGKVISLPDIQKKASTGFLRKNRNLTPVDLMWLMMETYLTEEELATLDEVPAKEFQKLQEKWAEYMEIDMGESVA